MAVVGEPLEDYVFEEIQQRQTDQYSGFEQNRTDEQLQYLNNKSAWVKLASSVEIGIENIDTTASESTLGKTRLEDIGLTPSDFMGKELAKKFTLFNTVNEVSKPNSRSGIAEKNTLWNSDSIYGLGGTEFGLQPTPGITDVSVTCINRGSIRKAQVNFKAYNKFQFDVIELLYLRIGFHVLLEWGNDKYYDKTDKKYQSVGNTILEDKWFQDDSFTQLSMIKKIEEYRGLYSGNYDGFFGRVSNFTWSFNPDGTYDITLDLVTVGDIIESLTVNLPSTLSSQFQLISSGSNNEDEATRLSEDLDNIIDDWLYSKSGLIPSGSEDSDKSYFQVNINEFLNTQEERDAISEDISILKVKESFSRFVTVGEFFNKLNTLCIPDISNNADIKEKIVEISTLPQFVTYNINQSSLNPKVCLFKFDITDENLKGIFQPHFNSVLKDYIIKTDEFIAGDLLNLYLNFAFIKRILRQNTDKEGKLSLYKCLQSLCDEVNIALGGVNKLEPVIIDDKIISIIDQNVIPGLIKNLGLGALDVPLEIYGHDTVNKKSNFVKDIDLKTSITPDLASMVTIGATAGGGSVKGMDVTSFSKWNAGLRDRFNKSISYTEPNFNKVVTQSLKKQKEEEFGSDWDSIITLPVIGRAIKKGFAWLERIASYSRMGIYTPVPPEGSPDPSEEKFTSKGVPPSNYTRLQYINARYNLFKYEYEAEEAKNNISETIQKSYISYLMEAYGGNKNILISDGISVPPIPKQKSLFLDFNDEFINKAKNTYSEYLRTLNKTAYDKSIKEAKKFESIYQSNQVGFIPITLGITLQGISGVKIYNKLNVRQGFLPNNYPKSVYFIITKVDHQISNNEWTTSLDTLSVPKIDETPLELITPKYKATEAPIVEGLVALNERGPIPPVSRGYSTGRFIDATSGTEYNSNPDRIARYFHPDAKGQFLSFLTDLRNNYPDYVFRINSIQRTYQKSVDLKKQNSKNATPGKSIHNFNAAMDMNVTDPNGKTYRKEGNKADWINSGIVDLAQKYGLGWGGYFSNYNDDIHFYFDRNLKTSTFLNQEELYKRAVAKGDLKDVDFNKVPLT